MKFAFIHDPLLGTRETDVPVFTTCFQRIFNNASVNAINVAQIHDGQLDIKNFDAVILPGIMSDDSAYPLVLAPNGNQAIRSFVETGGIYMGFCAGAYHAAASVTYKAPWHPHKQRTDGLLALFADAAVGPVETYACHRSKPLTMPVVTLESGQQMCMPYGNGPSFHLPANTATPIRTIAAYADIEGTPPAIIGIPHGKGYALLFGVLPQYTVDWDIKRDNLTPERFETFRLMKENHQNNVRFWRDLFTSLNRTPSAMEYACP